MSTATATTCWCGSHVGHVGAHRSLARAALEAAGRPVCRQCGSREPDPGRAVCPHCLQLQLVREHRVPPPGAPGLPRNVTYHPARPHPYLALVQRQGRDHAVGWYDSAEAAGAAAVRYAAAHPVKRMPLVDPSAGATRYCRPCGAERPVAEMASDGEGGYRAMCKRHYSESRRRTPRERPLGPPPGPAELREAATRVKGDTLAKLAAYGHARAAAGPPAPAWDRLSPRAVCDLIRAGWRTGRLAALHRTLCREQPPPPKPKPKPHAKDKGKGVA